MAINFIYPGGNPNFPRSYVKGFVGSVGVMNLALVGDVLSFNYLSPAIHVDYVIYSYFTPWNSNAYSLEYVFDPAASQGYSGGVPVPSTQGIRFVAMPDEPAWRIQVLATLALDTTQRADLAAAPAGYWRPMP